VGTPEADARKNIDAALTGSRRTRRGAALLLAAAAFAMLTSCAKYVRIESRLVDIHREAQRDVTCTPQFESARPKVTTVAVRAPDVCIDKGASEQTGQAKKAEEVLRTRCGVEMAEVERALTRQGYAVSSWRDLASMVVNEKLAAKDAALKLNAQVLFQVNSLEKVRLSPDEARWERTYFMSSPRGERGPGAEVEPKVAEGLKDVATPAEDAVLRSAPFGAMVDVNAVLTDSGQSIWFYRWRKVEIEPGANVAVALARGDSAQWERVQPEGDSVRRSRKPGAEEHEDETKYFIVLRDVVSDFANEFHGALGCAEAAARRDAGAAERLAAKTPEETPEFLIRKARSFHERGLRSDEERAYRDCVKLDGHNADCHYALFELFRQDHREKDAKTACMNFMKFADAEKAREQWKTCERFLGSER
jgi:hypothetical protein